MIVASFYIRSCVFFFCVCVFCFFYQLPVENSGENYFHFLQLLKFFKVTCFERGSFYTSNGNFGDLQIFATNGNLSSFQKILIFVYFLQLFFCPFFNLRVIPETEERLSRFEEYYWLAKIRRPYEPPLGYANSQYSTKQIWHSDIMRPSRIKLFILCCWKQTFRLCLF